VKVAGLYETGLMELDRNIVLCDIRLLQQLLDWSHREVDGYELYLQTSDTTQLRQAQTAVNRIVPYDWQAYTSRQLHSQIFDWIGLQHQNVWFILVLLLIVAIVNMSTAILILITERTRSIGLLKALGATDGQVRQSFLWQALFLIGIGVLAGNALGLGLLALQDNMQLITMDPGSYFVRTVPVGWPWMRFLSVNLVIILLSTLAMLVPSAMVLRISPVRALRFD
jgi:lipoprotein-releasing system permease protein